MTPPFSPFHSLPGAGRGTAPASAFPASLGAFCHEKIKEGWGGKNKISQKKTKWHFWFPSPPTSLHLFFPFPAAARGTADTGGCPHAPLLGTGTVWSPRAGVLRAAVPWGGGGAGWGSVTRVGRNGAAWDALLCGTGVSGEGWGGLLALP